MNCTSTRFVISRRLFLTMSPRCWAMVMILIVVNIVVSPTEAALVNYWDFNNNNIDTASSFAGNNSANVTNFSAGNATVYQTLLAGQAGPSVRTAAGGIVLNLADRTYWTTNSNTADNELQAGFTWSSWIYIHRVDTGGINYVFTDMPGAAPPGLSFFHWGNPTTADNMYLNSSTGSAGTLASLVPFQTWAFMTITSDGSTWSIYKNGVVDANFNAKPTTRTGPPAGTHMFQLGNSAQGQYRGDTYYANMSTWDNYLTPSQVTELYNNDGVPISLEAEAVPEPGALALMALGAVGLLLRLFRPCSGSHRSVGANAASVDA